MNAAAPSEAEDLAVHVAHCEERYKTLFRRLERIEKWQAVVAFGVYSLLIAVIGTLLYRGAPWQ